MLFSINYSEQYISLFIISSFQINGDHVSWIEVLMFGDGFVFVFDSVKTLPLFFYFTLTIALIVYQESLKLGTTREGKKDKRHYKLERIFSLFCFNLEIDKSTSQVFSR